MGRDARVARSQSAVDALALAGCWAVPGQNPDRTAHNAVRVDDHPGDGRRAHPGVAVRLRLRHPASRPVDPVVSSGGRARWSLADAPPSRSILPTAEWLWLDSGVSPFCETGDTAFMQFIRDFSPPFVVGRSPAVRAIGAPGIRNAPRPPDYVLIGGVTHYDLAAGELLSARGPGMVLSAVRGDRAVATSYRVVTSTPPPPLPQIPIQSIVSETVVGSISRPDGPTHRQRGRGRRRHARHRTRSTPRAPARSPRRPAILPWATPCGRSR